MVYHNARIKLAAGQICWREAGDSNLPVVILLHGSWHDGSQWDDTIELLSKSFHCFALDLLGFGNSIAPETPMSIQTEVDCLHEFLTALNLGSIYLVGHSLGGWIATSYALKHPELIRGIITIVPEGFSLTNWKQYSYFTKLILANPLMLSLWCNGLEAIASISDNARLFARKQTYWDFFRQYPATCQIFFQRSTAVINRELVADRLGQLRMPLLVLQNELDQKATMIQSQAFAKAVRQSEYKLITNAEATISSGLCSQVSSEIKDFIDRVQLKIDREEVELW
jgi:pimeloyl-ACP methyl ester carboxylesterase